MCKYVKIVFICYVTYVKCNVTQIVSICYVTYMKCNVTQIVFICYYYICVIIIKIHVTINIQCRGLRHRD